MRGPIPSSIDAKLTLQTGNVAMTTPGRCHDCGTRVDGEPLATREVDALDATVSLWCCEDCYYDALADPDWNDAKRNL